jgi:hypothetical protein
MISAEDGIAVGGGALREGEAGGGSERESGGESGGVRDETAAGKHGGISVLGGAAIMRLQRTMALAAAFRAAQL